MLKRMITGLLCMLLLFSAARAEGVQIKPIATTIGENAVVYPQLEGMADKQLQDRINNEIVVGSHVSEHLMTLITLGPSPMRLWVDYRAAILQGRVFSAVVSARGRLPKERDGHEYTAFNYDITNGQRVALEDLFVDAQAAVAQMEAMAEASLSGELSSYLEAGQILPLPKDCFTLDESGITFWYPSRQWRLHSGRAGSLQFRYEELNQFWKDAYQPSLTDEPQKALIAQYVGQGRIPHLAAAIGQPMQELVDAYRLLRTPDEFPGGRYVLLEDVAFRDMYILTDALHSDWADSVVEGIQMRRGGFGGLIVGQTAKENWRKALGQPDESVCFTESMAFDYLLPMGQYDVYPFEKNELRLYADENSILTAIQIGRIH